MVYNDIIYIWLSEVNSLKWNDAHLGSLLVGMRLKEETTVTNNHNSWLWILVSTSTLLGGKPLIDGWQTTTTGWHHIPRAHDNSSRLKQCLSMVWQKTSILPMFKHYRIYCQITTIILLSNFLQLLQPDVSNYHRMFLSKFVAKKGNPKFDGQSWFMMFTFK